MDKERIRTAILQALQDELDRQTGAALESKAEATSEESKAEHKYDMRAQEAAYLAEGQARQAAEIAAAKEAYRTLALPDRVGGPADLGSVVTLENAGRSQHYFLGPTRGGLDVAVDDTEITVITPVSPLGRQLLGRRPGDSVQLPGRGGSVTHRVAGVS